MRRMVVLSLVGMVAAATLGMSAPARADEVIPCKEGAPEAPPIQTVYEANGWVYVAPEALPGDLVGQANWTREWATWWGPCWLNELGVTDHTACFGGVVMDIVNGMDPLSFYFRYVSINGTTVGINRGQLEADAASVSSCLP